MMTRTSSNSNTDPESTTHAHDEEAAITNEEPSVRKLSTVSRKYDINGDGKLDEAEQKMRDMDVSSRGYLTNDKVYELMQRQIETQEQLFRSRKITAILMGLVFLLALSNLGTSFAAARLAKDTSTNDNEELTHKSTNEALSTQSTVESFEIARTTIDSETGERRLCNNRSDLNCKVDSYISMDKRSCGRMVRKCKRGNTVNLYRLWPDESISNFQLCPFTGGTLNDYDESRLTNARGEHFFFDYDEWGNCRLHGNAVLQDEGMICEVDGDCDIGLGCDRVPEKVEACQRRCGFKRWAGHKVLECQDKCNHKICNRSQE